MLPASVLGVGNTAVNEIEKMAGAYILGVRNPHYLLMFIKKIKKVMSWTEAVGGDSLLYKVVRKSFSLEK